MYGLVFGGGGVRGAYQVGVWKALNKMKIKATAVTGASIGAINAALYAQGSFKLVEKLWRGIAIDDVIALPEDSGDNLFEIKNLIRMSKDIYKNDGFDMSPFKGLLSRIINEERIRRSPIDFGCTTYSVSGRTETNIFKADIPRGSLVDYLMASASIMGIKKIDSERYTDGGVSNNMPVDMLISRGYTDIIAVNVRGAGVYKNVDTSGCNIINIKYSEPETGMMEFDSRGIERSIDEGYLDCLKIFGMLGGDSYYIKKENKPQRLSAEIIRGLEKAAEVFGVERLRIYTLDELIDETMSAYFKAEKPRGGDGAETGRIIPWLIERLEGNSRDFIKSKLEIFGSNYEAASAILYFKRKLR